MISNLKVIRTGRHYKQRKNDKILKQAVDKDVLSSISELATLIRRGFTVKLRNL